MTIAVCHKDRRAVLPFVGKRKVRREGAAIVVRSQEVRHLVDALVGDAFHNPDPRGDAKLRLQSRHQLFPQVLRLVHAYVKRRVDFGDEHPCEIGQEIYIQRIVERLLAAIQPDESSGESPRCPF